MKDTSAHGGALEKTSGRRPIERSTLEGLQAVLEWHGRLYGELGLALTFTRTNDQSKGDPKQGVAGWPHTAPLPHPARGIALMTSQGQSRNPALVARASRLIVVETDTPERLAQFEALGLPQTVTVQSSARYKRHHWFRPWGDDVPAFASIRLEKAAVTADADRLYLVPPAIHPTGAVYRFLRSPQDTEIAVLPKAVYDDLVRQAGKDEASLREQIATDPHFKITEGRRREAIFRYACMLRRWETDAAAIEAECQRWNVAHCEPPVARILVHRQVEGAMRKAGGHELLRFTDV